MESIPVSPVSAAFPHIQWDPLGSLRLTGQETSLLRMAETNPMEYTLADSRDASMYARVLLKLLSEAILASGGSGNEVARLSSSDAPLVEDEAIEILDRDPLGVVTHYAVTKLYEILAKLNDPSSSSSNVSIASVFYTGKEGILVDHWKSLLRILNKGGKGDSFAQTAAATCLSIILVVACPSQRSKASSNNSQHPQRAVSYSSALEPLEALTAWIVSQLKNSYSSSSSSSGGGGSTSNDSTSVSLVIPALITLMGCTETRVLFASCGGVKYLSRHLRLKKSPSSVNSSSSVVSGNAPVVGAKKSGGASVQQMYELAFCLWTMTYELNDSADIRADFARDGAGVHAFSDLISVAPREKIIRVSLSALRNLATCAVDSYGDVSVTEDEEMKDEGLKKKKIDATYFLNEMIACGCLKSVQNLKERQWKDPDIIDDITKIYSLLVENYHEMTRWEVYKSEVEMGNLQWGSTHTEPFFKENAKSFEGPDGDFSLVKILIALVTNQDEDVAAIACHDIGEFARHYPNGRQIAKRLGAKDLVMPLIEHDNVELQRHALQCVSKIMVQNWEYAN